MRKRSFLSVSRVVLFLVLAATPAFAVAQAGHTQHGAASTPQRADTSALQPLMAVFQRMMADPVIRERVATDPVLQRMLQSLGALPGMQTMMQGTQNMPGMQGMQGHTGMDMAGMQPTLQDQQQALNFIARLLSDPSVQAKIQDETTLRRLWADPDVQRRVGELRCGAKPGTPHKHN